MPKSKPTQVIVHRIELQEKEREMAEALIAGKTLESVGKGAVYVVGAGAVVAGAYVAWWTLEKVYGWMGDIVLPSWVDASLPIWSDENRANFREANPTLLEQVFKGPSILWAMARS